MTYREYRRQVIDLATANLHHCKWFRGLRTNSIEDDWRDGSSIETAAVNAEMETAYWDRPGGILEYDPDDGLGVRDDDDSENEIVSE